MSRISGAALASFTIFGALSAVAGPLGTSVGDAALSAKYLATMSPSTTSGIYWFDTDGAGASGAFQAYADMTTAGGGWLLGLNSRLGSVTPSTDMISNLGTVSLSSGHTRNVYDLAIAQTAEIRHRLVSPAGQVLFDGYYTGTYHDVFGSGGWTVLEGSLAAVGLNYHNGMYWTTPGNDRDLHSGNCATMYGNISWYYRSCFTAIPRYNNAPYSQVALQQWSIYVRETASYSPPSQTVPEPSVALVLGGGLLGIGWLRRRGLLSAQ